MKKLAVDPSINDVGWCSKDNDTQDYEWGYIKVPPRIQELNNRTDYIANHLPPPSEIDTLIIEYPQFMNAVRGQIAAQMGYTLDLAYICGYLAHYYKDAALFLYTPNQWKGQLPKRAIQSRFLRMFGEEYKDVVDHSFESCMLLVWHEHGHMIW